MENQVRCYNKGCLQTFDPTDNKEDSCTYHPGEPVFHDVYKSWSCCKKKTTDFTVFLSTKGCTVGPHNPDKPILEKNKSTSCESNEVVTVTAPKPPRCAKRLPDGSPMKSLPVSVAQSLKTYLLKASESSTATENGISEPGNAEIAPGTQCKRPGCSKQYSRDIPANDPCHFHDGQAIFHEGMKYWSCCQRKTSDFDSFLQQAGCTKGEHLWIKRENIDKFKPTNCRYDWHQTSDDLYVTVYSKAPYPLDTLVECNEVNLKAHISFDDGNCFFDLNIPLWGAIDVNKSLVTMTTAKVEVRMKKRDIVCWPRLFYYETA